MKEVLEISSSPEPEAGPSNISYKPPPSRGPRRSNGKPHPRPKTRVPAAPVLSLGVFEISDSDTDPVPIQDVDESQKIVPVAGPSRSPQRRQTKGKEVNRRSSLSLKRAHKSPLFLLSDDESEATAVPISKRVMEGKMAPGEEPSAVLPVDPDPRPLSTPPLVDPIESCTFQVLDVIPDVDPDFLRLCILEQIALSPNHLVERVLHTLFEDPSYPKVDPRKRKLKEIQDIRDANEALYDDKKRAKVDYMDERREFIASPTYCRLALERLQLSFPSIPKPYLARALKERNNRYALTHFFLFTQIQENADAGTGLPYRPLAHDRKGKGRVQDASTIEDEDFDMEHEWVMEEQARRDTKVAEKVNEQEYEESGEGIECGCCFGNYPFDQMVQCPEAHLFCNNCITSLTSNVLVAPPPISLPSQASASTDPPTYVPPQDLIICPALCTPPCKRPIPSSELKRALPETLYKRWERETQRRDLDAARVEGMEECPFCEWRCIMTRPKDEEKLFRCGNLEGGCGVVSCRLCQKLDHLPKSCKEFEEDKKLDGRHTIEEAMTQALMRNCPKCKKAFIKENGCNKMTCPNCHTISCYVCRTVIQGYEHFSGGSAYAHASTSKRGKCALWAPVEQNHAEEVAAAREKALAEYKRAHPDANEEDLKVDLPPAAPTRALAPGRANAFDMLLPPPPLMLGAPQLMQRLAHPPPALRAPAAHQLGLQLPLAAPPRNGHGQRWNFQLGLPPEMPDFPNPYRPFGPPPPARPALLNPLAPPPPVGAQQQHLQRTRANIAALEERARGRARAAGWIRPEGGGGNDDQGARGGGEAGGGGGAAVAAVTRARARAQAQAQVQAQVPRAAAGSGRRAKKTHRK